MSDWRPIETAPTDGTHFIGAGFVGRGLRTRTLKRRTWYGKASHIGWHGWCYCPQHGTVEDITTWSPTSWKPL